MKLTDREKEILNLSGNKNKEIATALNISIKTVQFHKKNIFEKLEVDSIIKAIIKYNQMNIE